MERNVDSWTGPLKVLIAVATVFTATVHLELAAGRVRPVSTDLSVMFLLAALGYAATLVVAYAPIGMPEALRWLGRLGLIAVTASTIVAYFIVVGFVFDTVSLVTKLVEVVLLVSVVVETVHAWNERSVAHEGDDLRPAAA